jgi:hypothetical protein
VAVPTESYMKLVAGSDDTHTDIYSSSRIKIGDIIRITGTASNNGVFFVSDITVDNTNVYYILKGNRVLNEDSNTNRDIQIDVVRSTGDKLIALGDVDSAGNIDVWSQNATTNSGSANNGWTRPAIQPTISGNDAKYIFHFADEALRVCNINEQNSSYVKWYGYIQRHQFAYAKVDASDSNIGSSLVFAEWQEHPNLLRSPRMAGNFSFCYINSPNVNGSTNTTLSSSEHDGTQATNYYSEYRGVATIKKDSTSDLRLNGAHNSTTEDFTFENSTPANVLDQSILGEVISIGSETNGSDGLGAAPKEFMFCTKISGSAGSTITYSRAYGGNLSGTAPYASFADTDRPIIERGLGFNIGITDGTADGNWEAATYEFYQSFIYDDNQESLPVKMGDGDDTTNLDVGTHTAAGGKSLRISVYADLAYSGRISGARVYIRKQNTDDDLTLLVDIDIIKGIRTSLDGNHNNWTYETGKGYYVIGDATGNSVTPNIDTYTTINGFSPDVKYVSIGRLGESYKASVVAGRRTFIANVRTFGSTGEIERFGDRIMYSEVNKFDTFLPHNFIDVSKGDFGEYTALEVFADRLLAFKHNLVHIINISSPSSSGWYLEDTIKYHGVSFPYSVTRTEFGVAWVNEAGCFLYDGNKVVNLIEKKIAVTHSTVSSGDATSALAGEAETGLVSPPIPWFEIAQGASNYKDPLVGYDAISNSLIVIRSASDSSTNSHLSYIYDFDSNGWIFSTELIANSKESTNFVTDWNNNLIHAIYDGSSDMDFKKYLPVPSSTLRQEFITKDIDFKSPGTTKKIYAVTMTYRSSAEQQRPLEYAVDGTQSFSSFTHNITPQGDTGGAGYLESTGSSGADWDVAIFKALSPISCQSIQFRLNLPTTGTFEVNDMTIEYRVIRNKMVS